MLEKLLKVLLVASEIAPTVITDTATTVTKVRSTAGLEDKIASGLEGALAALESLKGVL